MEKETQTAVAVDSEYSTGTVPQSERRSLGSLVFTWIGYVFTVTIMSAGGQIANGAANFGQAMIAVYVGYAILFLIAMATSVISMRTGLSFGLISRFSFGKDGAKLISFFTTITLCGWFSINCYLMGDVTHILFPAIPRWPVTLIFGALMVFSALKGQKVMNFIGLFACVAVFIVGITAVVVGIKDANTIYPGGILAINKEAQVSMTQLITIAVGSCVCGCCSWAPDLMRFSKDYKTTTGVMAIGLGICGPFMLLIGIVGMLVYGEYDIAYILKEQGLLSLAFIGLFANIWSTAQGNAYSSSLNLASIFTKIKREKLLVIFGVIGTFIGLFGLYQYFSAWLSFLATAFPPMAGVVIADYVVSWRGRTPELEKAMPHLDRWNIPGLACYLIGVSTKWWFPNIGIPAINSFVVTMILEAVCGYLWLRKRSDAVKLAAENPEAAV